VYGLPPDFDASFFIGRTLTQTWFQEYSVQFLFSYDLADGPTISLQSTYLFRFGTGAEVERAEVPVGSSSVMQVIGKHVVHASGTTDGTLRIEFEGGASIEFLDDNEAHESYQIQADGRQIIV
jgi:hypothetical protein